MCDYVRRCLIKNRLLVIYYNYTNRLEASIHYMMHEVGVCVCVGCYLIGQGNNVTVVTV